ncbi:flavin reductase family protein (plasmid) [Salipiger sp. H15]|uniref:Flavin reductase family protein n=1 Tax=Alloyangia sp. H15 TaxID=3029062 RepID=A0AAU8ARH3_9RHOB
MTRHSAVLSTAFDARRLRDVLGCFATGVTVVTSRGEGGAPVGLVVNSFSSVSLEPPQILWSLALDAPSRPAFRAHPGFAVNIMGAASKEATLRFARPGGDKFRDVDWRPGVHGVPVLADALATLECETETRIESGDHEIYIGRVLRIDARDGDPLIFHRGQFAQLGGTL